MKTSSAHIPRSRAPTGTGETPRIKLPLLPAERETLRRLAEADGRTLSAMARVLVLRGLHNTDKDSK